VSDLYLKIATEIKHFFQNDLHDLPLEIGGKFLRIEVKIPQLEPLNWLSNQDAEVKTYWDDRAGWFTMAGVGVLDIVAGDEPIDYQAVFELLRLNLSSLFPVRYYGGIGFRQDRQIDLTWQLFGNYRFVIPRFEIFRRRIDSYDNYETFFACNFRLNLSIDLPDRHQRELDRILAELARLNLTELTRKDDRQPELPLLIDRSDSPDLLNWHRNLAAVLTKFSDLSLEKVVLARKSTLRFTTPLQAQSILLALRSHNPLSYHFCFQINPATAFIGTSPERLYCRQDRYFETEALAGTRHRGKSSQIDRELSDNLRNSPKDLHEHQLVVQNLQDILAELCDSVKIDRQSTILKLNKVQHLYTQCQGMLKPDLTDADLLPKLHPTPAVGGFPRARALQLIHQLEPFERGWYAAPVGWVGHDAAEFAVAIRSGLVDRDRLLLFAGAGIVRGSQPDEEWAEIENKICHFTDLFATVPSPSVIDELPIKTVAIQP
jgi:menaquinone-specific isochorismate synthase